MYKDFRKKVGFILEGGINFLISVVTFFLGIRFVLKLFGASPAADFVSWWYETTRPLLSPFVGAFSSPQLENGVIVEFSTLFAIIIYGTMGWLLLELIRYIRTAVETKNDDSLSNNAGSS